MTSMRTTSLLLAAFLFASPSMVADAAPTPSGDGSDVCAGGSATTFLMQDDLGVVPVSSLPSAINSDPEGVKAAAALTLQAILKTHYGFSGEEVIVSSSQPIHLDPKLNTVHIRFKQEVEAGLPLDGASMALHFDRGTGKVIAANGAFHNHASILKSNPSTSSPLPCETAIELALNELKQAGYSEGATLGEWQSDCRPAAVQGLDGKPYLAYKRLYGHQPRQRGGLSEPYHVDVIFAERSSGRAVAVHPMVVAERAMGTRDCNNSWISEFEYPEWCRLASKDPGYINTTVAAVDELHNHLVDTYEFYKQYLGLHSMDGNDLEIRSLARYGEDFDNAFFACSEGGFDPNWDKCWLGFGAGSNSSIFRHWGQRDVVAHEFSHGVTFFSSNLVYWLESGALNEAFSDIMAAAADRLKWNKAVQDVWRVGEDVDVLGLGFRNMANPPERGDPDHYAGRYLGIWDNGGVHYNSGIVNKAFVLMVEGGTHPISGITVTPLFPDFDTSILAAATIFFNANVGCLTESSDFQAMRACTLLHSSASQKNTVKKAWDAVGVKDILPLSDGVVLQGLSLPYDHDVQFFKLNAALASGDSVTCRLSGANGDPDLSVRYGSTPFVFPGSDMNDCYSTTVGKTENCTTPEAENTTSVYVAVEAYRAATNMQLLCTVNRSCKSVGAKCTSPAQCCTGTCDGPTTPTRKCRVCKSARAACLRTSQCCAGLTCDGATASTRKCKKCGRANAACQNSGQCCTGLTCRNKKCKRSA